MIRVLVLIGTRPEAIKMAPVIRELRSRTGQFLCRVVSSGQHREMVAQALCTFDLSVDIQLDAMSSAKTLGLLTARLFQDLDHVYESEKPEWVLVQGDTNTAMVGALCAFYRRIKVGHIEAGLRTFDRLSPFPEEVNRSIIGQVADLHFAPTTGSAANLLKAGVAADSIAMTGNTVVDALHWISGTLTQSVPEGFPRQFVETVAGKKIVLVTAHRRESFGDGLVRICESLHQIAETHPECVLVFPVHLNPKVREVVFGHLSGHPRILLIDPLEYLPLVWLIREASVILTDSGGIQEEAPSFHKPVVILRDTTERPEVVEAGFGRLVGTNVASIVQATNAALSNNDWQDSVISTASPFGDGAASARIADRILQSAAEGVGP